jgi:non-lysosomal glucosylceramidase
MKFNDGKMGAVNGMGADGNRLRDNEQMEEVWSGATFGLASRMPSEGMRDEAFATAEGVYNLGWKERGYYFSTPDAYDLRGMFRASMSMRPGAIRPMEVTSHRA